jgi:hypothetical protein
VFNHLLHQYLYMDVPELHHNLSLT